MIRIVFNVLQYYAENRYAEVISVCHSVTQL